MMATPKLSQNALLLITLAEEAGIPLEDVIRALEAETTEEAERALGIPPATGDLPYKAGAVMAEFEAIAARAWGDADETL